MAHDEATKTKALTIALNLGPAEAARATGIPAGTIRCWLHRSQRNGPTQRNAETQRRTEKLRAAQEQITRKALAEAGEYIADRLKSIADRLYAMAEQALAEVESTIKAPGVKDRDSAAWLRSVVGAMHYGLQDGQLLAGKPTERHEVNVEDARARLAGRLDELAARRRAREAAGRAHG